MVVENVSTSVHKIHIVSWLVCHMFVCSFYIIIEYHIITFLTGIFSPACAPAVTRLQYNTRTLDGGHVSVNQVALVLPHTVVRLKYST